MDNRFTARKAPPFVNERPATEDQPTSPAYLFELL